jgi:hypothetical protein
MVKKTLKVLLVPIYNAACMPLLFAKNTGFEHRQISLAAIATESFVFNFSVSVICFSSCFMYYQYIKPRSTLVSYKLENVMMTLDVINHLLCLI